jgi:hypothetical protein
MRLRSSGGKTTGGILERLNWMGDSTRRRFDLNFFFEGGNTEWRVKFLMSDELKKSVECQLRL